jgi:hypothetical protein
MRELSSNQMLAALLTGLAVLWAWPTRVSGPQFVPPRIATASDIPYPVNTATPGSVTLLLKLDATARVENVQALRDIPPYEYRANRCPNLDFHAGHWRRESRTLHSFIERCL